MTIQRWTLVVVCAATAMLMLDIAVVNTALSRIAEDLNTGLSGLDETVVSALVRNRLASFLYFPGGHSPLQPLLCLQDHGREGGDDRDAVFQQ